MGRIIAKEAFIAMLATRMEKPEKEAAEWLGAVQDLIAESLRGNKKVLLTRFGSFDTSGVSFLWQLDGSSYVLLLSKCSVCASV